MSRATRPAWLEDLETLSARFSGLGIGPDLAGLSLIELRGVWAFLRRAAEV